MIALPSAISETRLFFPTIRFFIFRHVATQSNISSVRPNCAHVKAAPASYVAAAPVNEEVAPAAALLVMDVEG